MRVLQVIGGSSFGGGTRIILSLSKYLQARGIEVILNSSDPTTVEQVCKIGCEVFTLPNMCREIHPWHDMVWVMRLVRFIRQRQISIVHTHTSKGGMIGRLAARIAGVPVIVHTVHGFAFHEFSSPLTIRIYGILERIAARWCDHIVFVNEFHRQWALQLNIVPPLKAITIPNGIPLGPLSLTNRNSLPKEFAISSSAILIGSIGRLSPQKGFEYLIKAMPKVLARFPDTYAILVGDGPLRKELEQLANDLGVANHVLFTGFRLDADIFCQEFDIVVLPSLREGLSIALLEAMRAGKPIVTTAIGSNMSVVRNEEDALLTIPANAPVLALAIIRLFEQPDLCQRLGRSARKKFETEFTEDRMLEDYYKMYMSLIGLKCECLVRNEQY